METIVATHTGIATLEVYGKSYENRDLFLVTITDSATGAHSDKPAHWVDANIHSTETTAGVAACHLIHYLVTGYDNRDPTICSALASRTFYIVPRVNPDGVEVTCPQHMFVSPQRLICFR